jgi:hypothetical protein
LLDDGVRLEIALSGPAEFRWRRLPRPDRVYVDIVGAKLPGMPYELNVGAGGIDRLWARQNAWDTVRVVATLTERMTVLASRAAGGEKVVVELRREDATGRRGDGATNGRPTTNDQRPTTNDRREPKTRAASREPRAATCLPASCLPAGTTTSPPRRRSRSPSRGFRFPPWRSRRR